MERRILLAEDHPLMRRSLRTIFEAIGISDSCEVDSGEELLAELRSKKYTHLFLDLILEDGPIIGLLPTIRALCKNLNIMVLTVEPPNLYKEHFRNKYNIFYYVPKGNPEPDTIRLIHDFLANVIPPWNRRSIQQEVVDTLTLREKEILPYLLKGLSPKEIADEVKVTKEAIRGHKKRMLEKTNTRNVIELRTWASLNGLLS